ncbi:protein TRIGALACTOSYLDIACYLGLYCEROL 4, chloroplastic [Mangifera indica]|uniref:protein TRIGALACTOSYLDIACYLGLYCEROL 4, chloroplastic n=1 Tax=Mangifera indica TaxID=29780 RepID=UPI001CFBE11D|nr:protein TRIGALACTOSYLDIACYLGLYCEROL 4, chloroplastic [Mangifera indica]
MKKLRWAMEGDFWELDISTPKTIEATARPLPQSPLPLGLSRGTRLSRPRQIDFFQRFMAVPFVPSFSAPNFSLQRVLAIPFSNNWFTSLLGQFNLHKFVSSVKDPNSKSTLLQALRDKSLYAFGFFSEFLLTPDDTLLVIFDSYVHNDTTRKKAVYHHKFPYHDLTLEALWPGLFVDKSSNYWDVPFSMAVDLASLPSDSGPSYHFTVHHNSGSPHPFEGDENNAAVPPSLHPGFSLKSAFSYKANVDIWKSKSQKLKMVQPYDMFLSDPHVSASAIIGATMTASVGENAIRSRVEGDSEGFRGFHMHAPAIKSTLLADSFASVAITAQHGTFQRLFSDLTRFHACLDYPSGSKFLSGATRLAQDFLNSKQPSLDTVQAVCPNFFVSVQQQIAGPFSFRVDSGVTIDLKNRDIRANDPVFAIEYALQVLGSAKAIAWYSPKQQEFMIELRFFET